MSSRAVITYTHPDVLARGIAEGWADAVTDPTRIDWPARQRVAAIPFQVVDGRPLNPHAPTRIRYGRNQLGHWGEKLAADAIVTAMVTLTRWRVFRTRARYLVMVERVDGHGWAVPGGHVEDGEDTVAAAGRELAEEAGLHLGEQHVLSRRRLAAQYVPDPRASDEAWMITVPVIYELDGMPPLQAGSDAKRAEWVRADSYDVLVRDVQDRFGGTVFVAHRDLLLELLRPEVDTFSRPGRA